MMSEVAGYDILLNLKTGDSIQDAVIIVTMVVGDIPNVIKCLEMPANGYILKPFRMDPDKDMYMESMAANKHNIGKSTKKHTNGQRKNTHC